jgi:hypothetical protein
MVQPRLLVHLVFALFLILILFQSTELAQPSGYLVGRVLFENGEVAAGADVFFKVQKAFGAGCYSKECDSFQKAVFLKHLTPSNDGWFQVRIPPGFMNPPEGAKAYVYTVIVRTPEGKFRPFYAFQIGRDDQMVNEFVLKPPFLETPPGDADEIYSGL